VVPRPANRTEDLVEELHEHRPVRCRTAELVAIDDVRGDAHAREGRDGRERRSPSVPLADGLHERPDAAGRVAQREGNHREHLAGRLPRPQGDDQQRPQPEPPPTLRVLASVLRRQQENFILGVPVEVVRRMPARLRELLGYSVHPPFMGQLSASHPRKALLEGYVAPVVARPARPGPTCPSEEKTNVAPFPAACILLMAVGGTAVTVAAKRKPP
jgi:hypothetical protein